MADRNEGGRAILVTGDRQRKLRKQMIELRERSPRLLDKGEAGAAECQPPRLRRQIE